MLSHMSMTAVSELIWSVQGGLLDNQSEIFCQAYKKQTCGKGMLDVSDVVGSIMFLLSDQSRYVTGQNIVVDDGFSL
ncbi:SDR family oxidoreductase [Aeromonas veronii]|uniref:SDR family oxidoreductase n=1 Tax=Aeromonas veronii TaxID=654 RepID=UPI00311CA9B0